MLLRDFKNAINHASWVTIFDAQARITIGEKIINFKWTGTKTDSNFEANIDQKSLDEGKQVSANVIEVTMFYFKNGKKIYFSGPTQISFWNKVEMPL